MLENVRHRRFSPPNTHKNTNACFRETKSIYKEYFGQHAINLLSFFIEFPPENKHLRRESTEI